MRVYGLPVLQSAFSTALVVAPLLIPSSYILQSFAKIVFLIVFLGAVHGLIVLPALLAAYYSRRNNFNLAVALVKAVFIHCKLLRSVNVMEGGIIGTFRWYIFMCLVNSFVICITTPYLVRWRLATQQRVEREPRFTPKKEFRHQMCMMERDTQIYLKLTITVQGDRSCGLYFNEILGVPPLLPRCSAHSATFPPARAQLGRLGNIPETTKLNLTWSVTIYSIFLYWFMMWKRIFRPIFLSLFKRSQLWSS